MWPTSQFYLMLLEWQRWQHLTSICKSQGRELPYDAFSLTEKLILHSEPNSDLLSAKTLALSTTPRRSGSTVSMYSVLQIAQNWPILVYFCFKLTSSLVQAFFKPVSSLVKPGSSRLVELSSPQISSRAELRAQQHRANFEPSHIEPSLLRAELSSS